MTVRDRWTWILAVVGIAIACSQERATPTAPDGGVVPHLLSFVLESPAILFTARRDGNQEVYAMNDDGSGQTNLSNHPAIDDAAAWSPDRSRIAFGSTRSNPTGLAFEIWAMEADGTNPVNLTNSGAWEFSPTWSPDGSRIAYHSFGTGGGDIYVMNADGSAQTRLTFDPGFECCPDWSPDGSKVAFERQAAGGSLDVWVMAPDGSGQSNLTAAFPGRNARPAWSPDGSRIAFESDRGGDRDVWVMNADGSAPRNLSTHPAGDGSPAWSPSGTRIAFTTDRDGQLEVFAMFTDGSAAVNLSRSQGTDGSPAWATSSPIRDRMGIVLDLIATVEALVEAGVLRPPDARGPSATLNAAVRHLAIGNDRAATSSLRAFQHQVEAMERSRRLGSTPAGDLRSGAELVIAGSM